MNDPVENEIRYGREQDSLRVFVSSQMHGNVLAEERRVTAKTINDSPMHHAWCWEDNSRAGAYHSEAQCVGFAGTSDELVLLLGTKLTPITRAEYEAARTNGAGRYIFLRQSDELDAVASAFVEHERTNRVVTRNFANISELRTSLMKSLYASAVRAKRDDIVRRRTIELGSVAPQAGPSAAESSSVRRES